MIKNTKLFTTISCCLSVFLVGCNNASSTSITSTGQKEFEGITFSDKTFDYDGNSHSIFCDNVPSFANITYDGNNIGVYQGDYASLGSIKGFNNIGDFLDDGGNVLYYGEW